VMQGVMLSHEHVQAGPVTWLTVAALLIGAVVSKVWFIVKHRATHRAEGWTIQGLVVGAGASAALLFALAHAPTGLVLDASAPGLGFGIAIGRVGCFLAGCCGGPPTAARWGIWSSDQRVGARRVPTQLMESASTLLLGLLALVGILTRGLVGGAYFVAVVTAYVVIREGLLRLRAERQPARSRVPVASIVAALALIVSLVFIVRG
jgi:phosphatidylglycerol---prolipoprotein diacylglyceryl transferase